tara:strand:- start:7607 stop:7780 length:174 start_codon:yes stop_codon:yes gene_type:complete
MTINEKDIDLAIKYIKLAVDDYDKFLDQIKKLPEKEQKEILKWIRNALKYIDKENNK